MPFLGINPNSVSDGTKYACAEILFPGISPEDTAPDLDARELANAFNVVDPEVTGLTLSNRTVYYTYSDESDD